MSSALSRVSPNAFETYERSNGVPAADEESESGRDLPRVSHASRSSSKAECIVQTHDRDPHRHMPDRNAMIASVREARWAGRYVAKRATVARPAATAT